MLKSQLIFLDTEFTNFQSPSLISIGLAASSGEEFYAEVPYPETSISPFVRDVVVPLLSGDVQARCSVDELHMHIRNWLNVIKNDDEITLCFDSQYDELLFKHIFDGLPPAFLRFRNVCRDINELLRYEFHKKNNLAEHHALNDALAMRYAFRERQQACRINSSLIPYDLVVLAEPPQNFLVDMMPNVHQYPSVKVAQTQMYGQQSWSKRKRGKRGELLSANVFRASFVGGKAGGREI